jgi:hypothetical protein
MFKWKDDLQNLLPENKAIMQTLNVHLIYYLLFVTLICVAFPAELMSTALGNMFLLGCSLFWLLRTATQFIFFRKIKANGFIPFILIAAFVMGVVLFALPVFFG